MDDLVAKTYPEDLIVHLEGVSVPINPPAPLPTKPVYQLLYAANADGDFVTVTGGTYVWAVVADNFSGATVTLQCKGPDGVTIFDVVSATTNISYGVYIGEGTEMRVTITGGPPVAVYSDLRAYLT